METGYFKLVIRPKKIYCISQLNVEESHKSHSGVFLHYKTRHHLQSLPKSPSEISSKASHVEEQFSYVSGTWTIEQIDDFVRKLGFLESQIADVDQNVKFFQQQSQVMNDKYIEHVPNVINVYLFKVYVCSISTGVCMFVCLCMYVHPPLRA